MKLSVSSQQQEYFEAQHLIEFEGLLTKEDISVLEENIEKTLATRLRCPLEKVWKESPEKLFKAGLNFSTSSLPIRKLITAPKLSSIASQLYNQKPFRFGYDLYISPENVKYLEPLRPFREICCLQGLLGGIMICLKGEKAGQVSVFGSELQIDPAKIFGGAPFLLVAHTHPTAVFIRKIEDPMSPVMQERGYIYGDRLNDSKNPIIYK